MTSFGRGFARVKKCGSRVTLRGWALGFGWALGSGWARGSGWATCAGREVRKATTWSNSQSQYRWRSPHNASLVPLRTVPATPPRAGHSRRASCVPTGSRRAPGPNRVRLLGGRVANVLVAHQMRPGNGTILAWIPGRRGDRCPRSPGMAKRAPDGVEARVCHLVHTV